MIALMELCRVINGARGLKDRPSALHETLPCMRAQPLPPATRASGSPAGGVGVMAAPRNSCIHYPGDALGECGHTIMNVGERRIRKAGVRGASGAGT